MDKDFDLKNDPQYQNSTLRERVSAGVKRICDEGDELKENTVKNLSSQKVYHRWKPDWNKNDL